MSGYTSCGCRDCFEIAITGDDDEPALCHGCEDAGCDAEGESECEADHAYGGDEELEHDHCPEEPWGPEASWREDFHSDG